MRYCGTQAQGPVIKKGLKCRCERDFHMQVESAVSDAVLRRGWKSQARRRRRWHWAREDNWDANEQRERQSRREGSEGLVQSLEFLHMMTLQQCKVRK